MKRIIILLILTIMALHSANRLGVLSFLYKERHNIAYTLGFIKEIPITICSSEYYLNKEIHIQDNTSENNPINLPIAREINLFFVDNNASDISQCYFLIEVVSPCPYQEMVNTSSTSNIFQPPKVS